MGRAARRLSSDASHTTRNLFRRWLSVWSAANLALMKNTGAERERRDPRMSLKGFVKGPDVPRTEFKLTLFTLVGAFLEAALSDYIAVFVSTRNVCSDPAVPVVQP